MIKVQHVYKHFDENASKVAALVDVSLDINEGQFVALCGPSGSGKTTLLNLIGCLDRPSSGKIFMDSDEISCLNEHQLTTFRRNKIGFVFQDFNLIPTFTAQENIEYILWLKNVGAAERKRRVQQDCERFSIAHLLGRRPSELSRGQQQRFAVARAIIGRPRVVLGDELTANLDHKTGTELMSFLKELNQELKITFVYATHDPVMMQYADRTVKLQDGKLS